MNNNNIINGCQVPVKKRNIGIEVCGKKCVIESQFCSRHKKEYSEKKINDTFSEQKNVENINIQNLNIKNDNEKKEDYAKNILNELAKTLNEKDENEIFKILDRELKKLEII